VSRTGEPLNELRFRVSAVDSNVYTFLNLPPGVTFSTSVRTSVMAEQRTLIDGRNAGQLG